MVYRICEIPFSRTDWYYHAPFKVLKDSTRRPSTFVDTNVQMDEAVPGILFPKLERLGNFVMDEAIGRS